MLYTNGFNVYILCISIWLPCKHFLVAIWLVPVSLGQPCFVLLLSGPITPQEKCIQKWISAGLVVNRWKIAKRYELCYRYLRSGHQGKHCPETNRCGFNDFKGTHMHLERPSNPPERVDAAVETRSAFGYTEIAGDVILRTVPVSLIGSEGQNIQVNAFLDDRSDSTYVRDDIVKA